MMTLNNKIDCPTYSQVNEELDRQLDDLYLRSFTSGYLSKNALEGNDRIHFFDVDDEITYRIQINHVRSNYSKAMAGTKKPALPEGAKCPICIENVGAEGKENLEILAFNLKQEEFFIQLTPFPLYHHHFVLITKEHRPMEVSVDSFKKQLMFLHQMPHYVVCSNSDREGAGASILSHLHFQVFKQLHLPIFEARERQLKTKNNEAEVSVLDFPLSVVKIKANSEEILLKSFDSILSKWRSQNERNSFNTVLRFHEQKLEAYLIFRHPDYTTPTHLLKYKYEGIGVIEACGEGIFPTPEGEEEMEINNDIRNEGKEILKEMLSHLNPLNEHQMKTFLSDI
ncbi:DUF4922 domain-containing protein [Flammeovirga sp. MY04]|uniref:DUF4922 domain-containing protein n=1 Tax=Flammeovirga sp. MY04 TaxID=1191459 RepID=UPI00082609D9|nr:DUF4922 domain-containing protein [Flammeovirga sp. MY04]ANQ48842.2 DUF4922 domain-containing protein [Flammeovirga sp. MY04]